MGTNQSDISGEWFGTIVGMDRIDTLDISGSQADDTSLCEAVSGDKIWNSVVVEISGGQAPWDDAPRLDGIDEFIRARESDREKVSVEIVDERVSNPRGLDYDGSASLRLV